MRFGFVVFVIFSLNTSFSQDSKILPQIDISTEKKTTTFQDKNSELLILEGKKNEVIHLSNTSSNKVTNNMRQVLSKVAGVNIWETDGSGIQTNFSTRGLSPNRNWEFNNRQNGYDISADVFGYPESYYNPPMEALERIEIIRGAAGLQFGPQFGGLVNYILKKNTSDLKFNFDNQTTIGSYGLINNYNQIYGKNGKWTYSISNQLRKSDGWRANSKYTARHTFGNVQYRFSENTSFSIEYTNTDNLSQQAGGLTDQQFKTNAQASSRSRNWLGIEWHILNSKFDFKLTKNMSSQLSATALWGNRTSVGNTNAINIKDSIIKISNEYSARILDRDFYRNLGLEWRNKLSYRIGKNTNDLAFGIRSYLAHTDRNQRGQGSTGMDYDWTEYRGKYTSAYDFETKNIALFAENTFRFGKKYTVSAGFRYEYISSKMNGRLNLNNDIVSMEKTRSFILFGLSSQYNLTETTNIYGSISQAFRPILFSDLVPPSSSDVVDPDLKDNSGINIDLGYRGKMKGFKFDLSGFYLMTNDKIGIIRKYVNDDPSQNSYQYRTNLGQSINRGIEAFIEYDFSKWIKSDKGFGNMAIYLSGSYIDAKYQDFKVYSVSGSAPNIQIAEKNLKDNQLENVPNWILSSGLNYHYKGFGLQLMTRYVSSIFTDAQNTELPNSTALIGKLDAYQVYDIAMDYKLNGKYNLALGVNNFTNRIYATRRASGYPGPGILPADGRTWYFTFGVKL